MKPKDRKRERESERTGRTRGIIGPYKGRDAWLYRWEDLAARDLEYARELVRSQGDRHPNEWPEEAIAALVWLIETLDDPAAN